MNKPYVVLFSNGCIYDRHVTEVFARRQVKQLLEKGINASYAYRISEV